MVIKTDSIFMENDKLSILAKAMGHPARIAILKHLASVDSCFFGEIKLPLSNATISQHLSELKSAGLVDSHVETPKVRYMINRKNWEAAKSQFAAFFDDISSEAGTMPTSEPIKQFEASSEKSVVPTMAQPASGWTF